MKSFIFFTLCFVSVSIFSACGPKAFTAGQYDDPNKVVLLDDKFNEADMQLIARDLVASLNDFAGSSFKSVRPTVMVGRVRNRTSEHIDVKSITDKIRVELIKSRAFRFSDKEARDEIAEEYDYQQGGMVSQETAKSAGKQVGADFLITGDTVSNVQQVGNDKVIFYKITLNLNNLESNIIEWSDDKEIRKMYKKRSIGF